MFLARNAVHAEQIVRGIASLDECARVYFDGEGHFITSGPAFVAEKIALPEGYDPNTNLRRSDSADDTDSDSGEGLDAAAVLSAAAIAAGGVVDESMRPCNFASTYYLPVVGAYWWMQANKRGHATTPARGGSYVPMFFGEFVASFGILSKRTFTCDDACLTATVPPCM